jgi:hypothetical protein
MEKYLTVTNTGTTRCLSPFEQTSSFVKCYRIQNVLILLKETSTTSNVSESKYTNVPFKYFVKCVLDATSNVSESKYTTVPLKYFVKCVLDATSNVSESKYTTVPLK